MANRLHDARSPYLRSAAHQPVHWYPWCDEAFRRAREEDRPILLDIGAAWCHWCHVMDHESYDDPQVAAIVNEHFVAVKVDRDERPDLDIRFQNAVSAISGQGGWPLTAFLAPDGRVFYGGTYFPKEDAHGRPGLKRLLLSVAETYKKERERTMEFAAKLTDELRRAQTSTAPGDLSPQKIEAALDEIARAFDIRWGGFGSAPKFPHASALDLILYHWWHRREEWMRVVAERTLERMAQGGICDQLGGGFHRYSTDARWIVPHFEKMLYDNAALLTTYSRALLLFGHAWLREVVEGTAAFLLDVLGDPQRGFGASQDADVGPGDDGNYFTWTLDEARAVLTPEELEVVRLRFDLHERGEMHHDPARNVLWIAADGPEIAAALRRSEGEIAELLASAIRKMRAARVARTAPLVDRTLYASWNGMAIAALLIAHQATKNDRYRDAALRALQHFLGEGFDEESGFPHALADPTGPRTLDDQVQMGTALLLAHQCTGDPHYLLFARRIAAVVDRDYRDPSGGAYFDLARGAARGPTLEIPYKPIQDAPTPGANAVAALFFQDLATLTGDPVWRERADEIVGVFAETASRQGYFAATYFLAASRHLRPGAHVVVVGDRADPAVDALHAAAWHAAHPDRMVQRVTPGEHLPAVVRAMAVHADGVVGAFVCIGTACSPPQRDPDTLRKVLEARSAQT
jgi:uncharacterized protein YyaL (SSP411 family)